MSADGGAPQGMHVLHGWHLSYFAGKTRSYLRYKEIPFIDHEVDAYNLLWKIPRKTGATVMPVVVTPQGEWLQDSKHIVEVLESRYPQRPVVPEGPRQRIAAMLLEAWADEWWIPTAMHYRWSFPENFTLFQHDAGRALLPGFPRFLQRRIVDYVAGTLRGYLPSVGVVPAQHAAMERWTESMLDALERHFAALPYLFGHRPSIADFALFGPLYGHLSRDPYPARVLLSPRPQLKAWVERMSAPSSGPPGDFLEDDALPQTLQPLFTALFDEFFPMVEAYRAELQRVLPKLRPGSRRVPRALSLVEFPMGAARFSRAAMPYTLWMMQRVAEHYRGLQAPARASVDAWLETQGASGALQRDFGPPLRRAGLHVMLSAA